VISVKEFLAQKFIADMEHPTYSPDSDPNDFWLFPKIKSALKGRRFQDTEDIQKKFEDGTKSYSTTEFQKCFQQWQRRWTKLIAAQDEYFEGDPSE
jgi:hypothetical protein